MSAKPFVKYVSNHNVHLGDLQKDLHTGDEIEFNGTIMRWGGEEFSYAKLTSAIRAGWLSIMEEEDDEEEEVPAPAPKKKDPPAPKMKATSAPKKVLKNRLGGDITEEGGVILALPDRKKMRLAREMEGMHVPLTVGSTSSEVEDLTSIRGYEITTEEEGIPFSVSSDGSVSTKSDARVLKTGRKLGATETTFRVGVDAPLPEVALEEDIYGVQANFREEAEEVAPKKKAGRPKKETATNSDEKVVRSRKLTSPIKHFSLEDGLTEADLVRESERNAVVLKAETKVSAKEADSGFSWDMSRHWKTRVKEAMLYQENPKILRQIMDMEVDSVKKRISENLNPA